MNYWRHFKCNMGVAAKCALLAVFHAAHALVPVELTSHEYWGCNFSRKEASDCLPADTKVSWIDNPAMEGQGPGHPDYP